MIRRKNANMVVHRDAPIGPLMTTGVIIENAVCRSTDYEVKWKISVEESCYEMSNNLYSDAFADYFFEFQRAVSLAEATET